MKIEYTPQQKKLFSNTGIDAEDPLAVLSMLLGSPMAIASNLGVEPTVRLAVLLASQMQHHKLVELVNDFEAMPIYSTGALDPKDKQ